MSEYQYVYFAAVDRPLDDEPLEFMEEQSTRAEVSRWEFSSEYHYSDFRGDAEEMLRRGYDVHLHYANFGVRKLMFRLPGGLPWKKKMWDAYLPECGIEWKADPRGRAGILCIEPEADADSYTEEFFGFAELTAALPGIRQRLINGDLRPLYLAWLAFTWDDEALEPPVPAGLQALPPELQILSDFYDVSTDLIAAAAERSPPAPEERDQQQATIAWIESQSLEALRELTRRMLTENDADARAETLARIRDEHGTAVWPVAEPSRNFAQLLEAAAQQQTSRNEREEQARARAREEHLAGIAAHPRKVIADVRKLVTTRSTANYARAALMLTDLREALGPKRGPEQAETTAMDLVRENPTLGQLKSALRKHGLIPAK